MVKDVSLKRPDLTLKYSQHYGNFPESEKLASTGKHGFSIEQESPVVSGEQSLDKAAYYKCEAYVPYTVTLPMPNPRISSYATAEDSAD